MARADATLPPTVVIPTYSMLGAILGQAKAISIAMASSTPGSVSMITLSGSFITNSATQVWLAYRHVEKFNYLPSATGKSWRKRSMSPARYARIYNR